MISNWIKQIAKRLPPLRRLVAERDRLSMELAAAQAKLTELEKAKTEAKNEYLYVPPGHYFSPIPSEADIDEYQKRLDQGFAPRISVIDLNEKEQVLLLEQFKLYYDEMPFDEHPKEGLRYYLDNNAFPYMDGFTLYAMIRHLKPRKVIEVGSGYSSCAILDTNERFFNNSIECTFIEPYPQLLLSLIKPTDVENLNLVPRKLQEVDRDLFLGLGPNDILFIDSTHVSKLNSDVNFLFFEILPLLNSGVYIHFHDIYYPFEYPLDWHRERRAWNEDYLLHAFLLYNPFFQIVYWSSFLGNVSPENLMNFPACIKNYGGSLWLQKLPGSPIPSPEDR